MRLGVVVPSFAPLAEEAIAAALAVERAGLDGAFVYDHLWPLDRPGDPAIAAFPLLGALAVLTSEICIGPLVARIGLEVDDVLVDELATVQELSNGRLIAGLGTGDAKSAAENLAYGIGVASALERRERLLGVAGALARRDIAVWVGGGSPATNAVARALGVPLNLWGAGPEAIARVAATGPVTWGGRLDPDPDNAAAQLLALSHAGAEWAVTTWAGSVEPLVRAAERAGIPRAR